MLLPCITLERMELSALVPSKDRIPNAITTEVRLVHPNYDSLSLMGCLPFTPIRLRTDSEVEANDREALSTSVQTISFKLKKCSKSIILKLMLKLRLTSIYEVSSESLSMMATGLVLTRTAAASQSDTSLLFLPNKRK